MAFFGNERVFTDGESIVTALPKVDEETVTDIVVTSATGRHCEQLAEFVRNIYQGAFYSTWEIG